MIGRRLGHYRIDRKLGEGGVGVVYRAVDELLGRVVALKVLLAELHSRPDVVERFRSEARTLARLNHPNVATLYSFEELEGSLAMVMEFVEGMTLANLTQGAGRLPPEHALPIFFQALDGIGHAHSLGIVHRDIKGSNLMLDTRGELKVMDFGIARIVGSERHTQLGHVVGTPEFMAPEQIRGDETDTRADVYSLGILLFLLLTGRTPFVGGSGFELMRAQVEEPPPALRSLAPELPEGLDAVVAGALEKDPDARIPSCQAFREALAPFAPAVERRLRGPGPVEVLARPDWRTASLEVALEGGAATALLSDAGQGAGSDAVASRDEPSLPVPAALHAHSHSESHSEAPTHRHPVSSPRLWRRPWLWGALLMACAGLNVVWWGRPAMDTPLAPDASLAAAPGAPSVPSPSDGAVPPLALAPAPGADAGVDSSPPPMGESGSIAAQTEAEAVPGSAAAPSAPTTPPGDAAVAGPPARPSAPVPTARPAHARSRHATHRAAAKPAATRARALPATPAASSGSADDQTTESDQGDRTGEEAGRGWIIRRQ